MPKPYEFLGVGSPLVDSIANVPESHLANVSGAKGGMELVSADELAALVSTLPSPPLQAPGGSAANTIVGLSQLGARTAFVGTVGNDEMGQFYRQQARANGLDTNRMRISYSASTGGCLSLVTPDSQRTCRTDLGAAMTLAPNELSAADFVGATVAHIEGYLLFNRELARRVLTLAHDAGCTVSLDLASFEVVAANKDVLDDLLDSYVDCVFANEDEARAYCGSNDPLIALDALARRCQTVAVKLGADGAWLQARNEREFVRAQQVNAIDTTGAGDLWASGFLYGQSRGWSLAQTGELAAMLGAAVVQQSGAVIPLDEWNRIGAWINEQGHRDKRGL